MRLILTVVTTLSVPMILVGGITSAEAQDKPHFAAGYQFISASSSNVGPGIIGSSIINAAFGDNRTNIPKSWFGDLVVPLGHRKLSVVAWVDGASHSETVEVPSSPFVQPFHMMPIGVSTDVYTLMGGLRHDMRPRGQLLPFVHLLFGGAYVRNFSTNSEGFGPPRPGTDFTWELATALDVGGGFGWRLNNRCSALAQTIAV
jgi:hypothetical protein